MEPEEASDYESENTISVRRPLVSLFLVLLLPIFASIALFTSYTRPTGKSIPDKIPKTTDKNTVLGVGPHYQQAQIYISGGDQGYSTGGLIALASTDEPAVTIGGYNIADSADIALYEANENSMLDYLVHDANGQQLKKTIDTSAFRYITSVKQAIQSKSSDGTRVPLPLGEKGIWYIQVKVGSVTTDAFILRSRIGVLTNEGDNELIFWGQNFSTKRSIVDGTVTIYNLQDTKKELQSAGFSNQGIAKTSLTSDADIAYIKQGDDLAVVPLNLRYLNSHDTYKQFRAKNKKNRYFIFTDRPIYKPGDTIYFKSVLRDDDDARYTIPTGEVTVKVQQGYSEDQSIFTKNIPISADGTISGEYTLPADAKVGYYSLSLQTPNQQQNNYYYDSEYSSNSISFDVEYYKKPEFSIDVTTPKRELIAGDKTSFTIAGTYFSGQPLIGQKIRYIVSSADYYEYEYLTDRQYAAETMSDDYRYGYWYGDETVAQGTVTLDNKGQAEIDLAAKIPKINGKSQVFSIEATIDDGSQTPAFSRKNILVYAGEYGIYRKDYAYGVKMQTPFSLPVTLAPYRNTGKIGSINLTAKVHRETWIAYQEANKKYPSYRKDEENLPDLAAKTDSQGNATFTFTPQKIGSYTITVSGKDSQGNIIIKQFYTYATDTDQPAYTVGQDDNKNLTISSDKKKYAPNDTAHLTIYSVIPNRDVLLSMERGRVDRFQIVHLDGKSGSVDIPLTAVDIPNMFATVASFSDNQLDWQQTDLSVSTDSKKLVVKVTPDRKTYGPGETATVNIQTTDLADNPVAADVALWAVDKAIFELSDQGLGNIFDTFWKERYDSTQQAHSLQGILVLQAEGGGCFAADTDVLMADGKLKHIQDVKVGDYVLTRSQSSEKLVKAKVLKTHTITVDGYLILNGALKVTANHRLWVNGIWQEAGSIQPGDSVINAQGKPVAITSIEWQKGLYPVYNLEIETYHTYFAGGIWVHNQKGSPRVVFKDTAYWNPSIHTGNDGRAQIRFTIPDNLTTWAIAAVGSTPDTRVGQTTNEITVSKGLIVRPVLPNILRTGDTLSVSAYVQNFTSHAQTVDVEMKFDSGTVEQAKRPNITLKPNVSQQFYWKVIPKTETDKAKFTFSAVSKSDKNANDTIVQEIPVRAYGFFETRAETGDGEKTYSIKLAGDSKKDKSKFTLSLAPTLVGMLPTAMTYLIDYPYGCVEQTTSRFVPAVIARRNTDIFASALADKDISGIVQKGISRLMTLQQYDGGWTWWFTGKSDPFITAYVVEYLMEARSAGFTVDEVTLQQAQMYLENDLPSDSREQKVARAYGLQFLPSSTKKMWITDYDNIAPDILAMAVMVNTRLGDLNPQTNGLNKLLAMAKTQGDSSYWRAGSDERFGSQDASTAFAIRAVIQANGDKAIAAKAVRYLTRNRQNAYWSNTFATAQVIRALVEYARVNNELAPNYTYIVSLDNKEITRGVFTTSKDTKDIVIPVDAIHNGSALKIAKKGDGQVYSTLSSNEFHTDTHAQAIDHGLTVQREYVNEKGPEYSLGVGDVAIVKITLGGLKTDEYYGIMHDELPAGLVPINEALKNEQYNNRAPATYNTYAISDKEVTENGMDMSLYHIPGKTQTYTYKARVVSAGTFVVPPLTTSLMYAPEIYARSNAETITVDNQARVIPWKLQRDSLIKTVKEKSWMITIIAFVIVALLIAGLLKRRRVNGLSTKQRIIKLLKRTNHNISESTDQKTDQKSSSDQPTPQ